MDFFETDPIEKARRERANAAGIPLSGGFELTPYCNMACNMCYVRTLPAKPGSPLLPGKQWLSFAEQIQKMQGLSILLTGGEPLLHPDFKEIYLGVMDMGFIVTVNSNGTLIDEEWADFFARRKCKQLNISLYGASDETYRRLCHLENGFSRVLKTLHLIHDRGIQCRITVTITRENLDELPAVADMAKSFGFPFIPTTYLYPPVRGGDSADFRDSRLAPAEAAKSRIDFFNLMRSGIDWNAEAEGVLGRWMVTGSCPCEDGLKCSAGKSGYWINGSGWLSPCTMLTEPGCSLLECSFAKGWETLKKETHLIPDCPDCCSCKKRFFCQRCAAASLLETGDYQKRPRYLCDVTDEMLKIYLSCLDPGRREMFRFYLKKEGFDL